MNPWSPAFEAWVDGARTGKLGFWRFAIGLLLILVTSVVAFIAVFVVWTIIITIPVVIETGQPPGEAEVQAAIESMLYGHTPFEVTLVLLAWSGMWVGVWLSVRLLQRRRLRTVLAAGPRMFWPDFVRAALATAVGAIVVTLISLPLHSGEAIIRSALDFDRWLVWLIPVAVATFVQTSAEEVVFRGYIMQTLATRFRSPWVWAGLSILSFCLIHFSSTFGGPTNLMVVVFAAIFGTLATLLVWHTGNLGAAVGMHFVNNLVGFTLIGSQDFFGGGALFYSTPLSTLGWSQALFGLASSVVPLGIAMLLMFEERSPLRLR